MKHSSKTWIIASIAAVALAMAGCSSPGSAGNTQKTAAPSSDQGDVTALVKAAKAEGTLTWFTAQTTSIAQNTITAFKAAYGINVEFVSLNAGILSQRYQTEAEAGKISADVISQNADPQFVKMAIDKGWGMKLSDAKLPVLKLGDFPSKYLQGDDTATIGFTPYLILYNKDNISGNMVPKDLKDLENPKYKDKIILTDPTTADSMVQFYDVIQQTYGDKWFTKVMANKPKFYPTISNGVQAMTAGEGSIMIPAANSVTIPLIAAGAPIGTVTPPVTSGSIIQMMLTASDKAPHPNAAKLFVNWLLSKSGNLAAWSGGYGASLFDSKSLPAGFKTGRTVTPELKTNVLKLLGLPTT